MHFSYAAITERMRGYDYDGGTYSECRCRSSVLIYGTIKTAGAHRLFYGIFLPAPAKVYFIFINALKKSKTQVLGGALTLCIG